MKVIAVKVRVAAHDEAGVLRIAAELTAHGFQVRQKMPELQMITGDLDEARVNEVRALSGVEAVEPEPGYQLPPLDPDTPQ